MGKADKTKPLVILEMANNHMGDVLHGKHIVDALAEVIKPYQGAIAFAIKFQFRVLETFIHGKFR